MNQPTSNSSLKQRHLSHLNSQLAQLHANLSDFNELINTTSAISNRIENGHNAWFVIHGQSYRI